MFDTEKIKNYNKLGPNAKKVFDRFLKRFYEAWESLLNHKPVKVSPGKGYLRVDLSDGSWLHVTPRGDWY